MTYVKAVHDVAHHRNGVAGESFYAVTFTDNEGQAMVATVFPEPGAVAVLCLGLLAEGCITFGVNSWRGDYYEDELRAAVETYELARA